MNILMFFLSKSLLGHPVQTGVVMTMNKCV